MAKAKEIDGLDCEASARAGIRLVLLSRLEEMCAFRAAALDWSEIEGVHDMRVASRRLRSALRDFLPYLRKRKLLGSKNDLKRVADALGQVRDEDVAISALEKLAAEAPPEVSAGIEQFAEERRLRRDRARSELNEVIAEDRLAELTEEFRISLERGLKVIRRRKDEGDVEKSAEGLSFRQAAREIICARFQELQDLSTSLYKPFKTKPLHRMRIAAKRLRYAIQLFAPCWNEPLLPFAKEIARLQTSLGELNDCDTWITYLGAALQDDLTESVGEGAEKRNAAFWLLDYFIKARADHIRDALTRWHEWETTGFRTRLVDILNDSSSNSVEAETGIS